PVPEQIRDGAEAECDEVFAAGQIRRAPTPFDRAAILVREALPTVRSGRAVDVTALAAETGLAPGVVLAALGLLAACGIAVKTGGGWALLRPEPM
ncbi:hypothetical protein KDL01_40275, partial [Actinospica durhamensis]